MKNCHKIMAFCILAMFFVVGERFFYGRLKMFSYKTDTRQEENLATSQNVGTGHPNQTGVDNSSTGDVASYIQIQVPIYNLLYLPITAKYLFIFF